MEPIVRPDLTVIDFAAGNRLYVIAADGEISERVPLKPGTAFSGFGAVLITRWLPPRRGVFLAIYSRNDALWLRVDKIDFNLCDRRVRLSAPFTTLFLRRRLIVQYDDAVQVCLDIWLNSDDLFNEFPDADFVGWIRDIAQSRESTRRYTILWDEASRGMDLGSPEVQQSLERRYREAGLR